MINILFLKFLFRQQLSPRLSAKISSFLRRYCEETFVTSFYQFSSTKFIAIDDTVHLALCVYLTI